MTSAKQRLEDLKNNIPPIEKKPAPICVEGDTPPGTDTPPLEGASQNIPPEEIADMVIGYLNTFLTQQGLTPLDAVQSFLFRSGIIGTAKKYDLSFDLEKYPELALIGGAAWIGFDKFKELKTIRAAKKADTEKEQPKPEAGAGDPPGGSATSGPLAGATAS